MVKETKGVKYTPLILLYLLVNGLTILYKSGLPAIGIDSSVILAANLLLFLTGCLNIFLQVKAAGTSNAHAMTRSAMAATFLRLIILGVAVFIYLKKAGTGRSANAIYVSMGLYVVYTILEVRIGLKLNKKSDAGN
jgi:hypothetical protein